MKEALDLTGLVEKRNRKGIIYYVNCDNVVLLKQCNKCGRVKDVSEFPKHKKKLGGCDTSCKECKAEYNRKYYKENKEEILSQKTDYYQENKQKISEYNRRYREENAETIRKSNATWRKENAEYVKDYERRRYYGEQREKRLIQAREYNARNKDKKRKYIRVWRTQNREVLANYSQKRRAKKNSLPSDFAKGQQLLTLEEFSYKCALTGESINRSWDHAIPLNSGHGGTTYGNMYPLRGDLNSSKGDRNIFEWFKANRQRFNLSQAKFDALIDWLAETNDMTVEEYTAYVYECHGEKYEVEAI